MSSINMSQKLNIEDCKKIMQNKLSSKNFDIVKYEVWELEEKRGYFGEHYKVKIVTKQNDMEKQLVLFMKHIAKPETGISIELSIIHYKKEVFIYNIFKQILNKQITCLYSAIPECYLTKPNLLVLEDLTQIGFVSLPRYEYLNYETIIVIVKALAKIHASSVIFEEKYEKNLGRLFSEFEETFYSENPEHQGRKAVLASLKGIYTEIDIFKNNLKYELSIEEFKKRAKIVIKSIFDLIKTNNKFRNVICHGDLWQTNFMMKYDNKHPVQCVLVDFQTARYLPPTHDIMGLLYLTTTREFRKLHMEEIKNAYYSELTKYLAANELDIKRIITYEEFLNSCDVQKVFGIVQAATYFQLTAAQKEYIAEVAKDKEKWEEALYVDHSILISNIYKKDSKYRTRLEESLMDLHDICLNL